MDNVLQLRILNEDTRSLLTPVSLKSLVINVDRHSLVLQTLSEKNSDGFIQSGGIEIRGLHVNAIPKRKPLDNPVVEKYMFIPYTIDMGYTLEDIVRICLHIAIENNMAIKIKTLEILNQTIKPDERIISPMILDIITDLPLVQAEVCILSNKNHPQLKEVSNNITVKNGKLPTDQSVLFNVGSKLLEDAEVLENVFDSLKPEGFLLTREQLNFEPSLNLVEVCFDVLFKEERLMLVRKPIKQNEVPIVIKISSKEFSWLPVLQKTLSDDASIKQKVILVAEKDPTNGIMGLFNCVRKETGGDRTRYVLKDALFENQTVEDFIVSCRPKAIATSLLDKYSRIMCPDLKHFVIFSSVTCSRGNIGQTNYGLSNSVMERICEIRRSEGLPALAIEWGAIGDVGLATSMAEGNKEVVVSGTKQQNIANSLEIMDHLLIQKNYPIVTSIVVAEKSAKKCSNALVDTVIDILGHKDFKNISLHSTLAELGIDSMMTVEIKHLLEVQLEVFLMPKDIRGITFTKLQEFDALDYKEKQCQLNKFTTVNESIELELLPSYYSVVRIPSLYDDGSTEEQLLVNHPTLFVIPGLEGIDSIIEKLSENAFIQVLCLLYDITGVASIEKLAHYHYQVCML
ncbi:NAD(P)-binding domain,Polyketide synthase, ketoreductase domain,Phosphopantetheine binding ACP [Cinara cedri]|uniref:NAD(P)-binding domain,Polyketide synthase, ketoreductase domain,Phosphopantetheine binding ACP n=1 Tax=Cinara cedri TaxID=506608 RepID=A0A5E4NA79_9HEMI|nr:NAD(P)-binding domain,Polyketide synthase, ketoreductase domain,Phosphopantetheine binding ACP [Cinara cedri]